MNSISSKFTALATALLITSLTMGALGISLKSVTPGTVRDCVRPDNRGVSMVDLILRIRQSATIRVSQARMECWQRRPLCRTSAR